MKNDNIILTAILIDEIN